MGPTTSSFFCIYKTNSPQTNYNIYEIMILLNNITHFINSKGHPLSADLRYGGEDSISPSTLIVAAIKG